jgi:hypothetical protein
VVNGSFEQDYLGWNRSGNQDVITGVASHGVRAARFNGGQKAPNAVLTQSVSTIAGRSYTLSFAYGVYSPVSQRQQRLQLTVQGQKVIVSQLIIQSAFGSNVQYATKVFSFTADSAVTTLSFRDASLITDSVDSFIDNVQVK